MNVGRLLLDEYQAEFNTTITETLQIINRGSKFFTHIYSPSVALILHMNNELWMNNWVEHNFRNPFSIDSIWIYHTHTISSQESEQYVTSQIEQLLTNLNSKSIIWNPLYFQLISDIFSFLQCCLSFWTCIEI